MYLNDEIVKAYNYAKQAHLGQMRRFENTPYFTHPLNVANLIIAEKDEYNSGMIVSALLHDVVEDNKNITLDIIEIEFGGYIKEIVKELTNDPIEIGDRTKKEYLLDKMIHMSEIALAIKLADRLDNIASIYYSSNASEEFLYFAIMR